MPKFITLTQSSPQIPNFNFKGSTYISSWVSCVPPTITLESTTHNHDPSPSPECPQAFTILGNGLTTSLPRLESHVTCSFGPMTSMSSSSQTYLLHLRCIFNLFIALVQAPTVSASPLTVCVLPYSIFYSHQTAKREKMEPHCVPALNPSMVSRTEICKTPSCLL